MSIREDELIEDLQAELEAAKQRELELMAVIERMESVVGKHIEPSQALREHEAKVLHEISDEFAKTIGVAPLVNGNYQQGYVAAHRDCISALRRMAEERRKK